MGGGHQINVKSELIESTVADIKAMKPHYRCLISHPPRSKIGSQPMIDYKIRLFYLIKPFIPKAVLISLRRVLVKRQLRKYSGIWPIYEPAREPSPEWKGWPDRKKFALVLTHDVESEQGVDNCLRLADLEEQLGFRSSFNFVGHTYPVPRRIREELISRDFEVGVHGLYHDSSLYHSRKEFLRQSSEINKILKEWNAVGFRSPCMYHNLEWIHDLDIEYDTSTFDTDPFEPQPNGLHTIFPIFIPGDSTRGGYMELPYTLPQDHTLFTLMQYRTIDVWEKKLAWLARNGGMALINTHPDYMSFNGRINPSSTYDVKIYDKFLKHVGSLYGDQYWHALPREIARICRPNKLSL
jgi:hypothetical protein